ncbi:hypothetical protein Glove_482g60 [Diversispora epigaea]|uniref:Uncharacterized protein n=1 Tax=Diversispora epigaea TaxID=1348612 RepID=A0A397GN54_9GLOM|nr:hypothetical protein Glove_482g60 [Diversispora epigaea]
MIFAGRSKETTGISHGHMKNLNSNENPNRNHKSSKKKQHFPKKKRPTSVTFSNLNPSPQTETANYHARTTINKTTQTQLIIPKTFRYDLRSQNSVSTTEICGNGGNYYPKLFEATEKFKEIFEESEIPRDTLSLNKNDEDEDDEYNETFSKVKIMRQQ